MLRVDAQCLHDDVLTLRVDTLTRRVDALHLRVDALTRRVDALSIITRGTGAACGPSSTLRGAEQGIKEAKLQGLKAV